MTPPLLISKILREAGFSHGFSTRVGGVSPPPYETLDFAVLRDPAVLAENHARLGRAVGFDPALLHQSMQVHGKSLVVAEGDRAATLAREADALVANPGAGHAVAVRVADCVPVLLADKVTGRVAAVHAGWKGVEAEICAVAVRHLQDAGATPGSILAAIGPCIGPCCFEVGADVADRIVKAAGGSRDELIDRVVADKSFVDLRRAVRTQLRSLGLDDLAIEDVPSRGREGCTRCDAKQYYSYRRDGDASGRLIAVIVAGQARA